MKRRIYRSMCLLLVAAMFITSGLFLAVYYGLFNTQMQGELEAECAYIAAGLNSAGDRREYLGRLKSLPDDTRITLVAPGGAVTFDNRADVASMENHLNRPEVAEAFAGGMAARVRLSDTLGTQTFYYAVRLESGEVLRLANTTDSVFSLFLQVLPLILLTAAAVCAVGFVVAGRMTNKIVEPINALNLDDPTGSRVYDELSPLLRRIDEQNAQIREQMDTLSAQQNEFSTITRNMSEGLVLLDHACNVLTVNRAAAEILGARRDWHPGENLLVLTRNLTIHDSVQRALGGEGVDEFLTLGDRTFQLLASPVQENGEVSGAVLLVLDVTERQKAERLRREFSANVSHELKTPLTSISGYAELLQNAMVQPQDIPSFAGKIHAEARRLISLIEDIIKLSRLDESDDGEELAPVDLYAVSSAVVDRLAERAAEAQVALTLSGGHAVVPGNSQMLDELVYNLCDNAIKYNHPGGLAEVSVRPGGAGVILRVKDTGIGIPREHQSRVFERFYRVDKSHSRATGGTGLGLSIVKHIAERHHAALTLASAPGEGTAVTVEFPAVN